MPIAEAWAPKTGSMHRPQRHLVTAALFGPSVVGLFAIVFSSKPGLADLLCFFFWPTTALAALVTGLARLVCLRRNGPDHLQRAP